MRAALLILFVSLLWPSHVKSQDSLSLLHKPKHALKISPFHFLGFYPTLQVAYEFSIAKHINLQADVGYVIDRNYLINRGGGNNAYENKRGTKVKLEARYYLPKYDYGYDGFYIGFEPYWNAVNFDRSGTSTECFDAQCQNLFIRQHNYKVEYREYGLSVKAGYVFYFERNIFLDIVAGWAFRNVRYTELTDNPLDPEQFFLSIAPNEEDRSVLAPLVGIRIGYRFR
jgi:hypothetical protein